MAIKVIKKSKKSALIRVPIEMLNTLLLKERVMQQHEKYREWFFANHYPKEWTDEYGSSHTSWMRKSDGKETTDLVPSRFV